ncbi:MAG: hypothetical protein K0R65_26 [Crocinitomicaceae bacterium]|jgi:uncharacterized protein (TIGR02231 family)|nr:hypothetical protein [Crocinitomicaceae bacterium]
MKKIIALVLLLGSFTAWSAEKENVKSTITDVTVYMQGAQVFRKANYTVKPGITEIIIDGICPTIDAKSIQVKATGNVVILDSKYTLFYPKPEEVKLIDGLPLKVKKDIALLEDSILVMTYDLMEIQDEIDVLNATKAILSNNGAIKGSGKVNDSIQLLKQAVEYYTLKMNELNKKLLQLNRRKNEKNHKKSEMQTRLNNLRNFQSTSGHVEEQKGPVHRLVITVSSKEVVTGKLSFSYLVSNAGWTPLYDLKSEVLTGKVNLNYKAQVFQNTGVNWDEVKLTISTNNPYMNKTKPTLHPWYIDYYTRVQDTYNGGAYKNITPTPAYKQNESLSTMDMEDAMDMNAARTSAEFVTMVDQVISAEFRIDLPYSIASNNEEHMVLIKNEDLTADFKYYTVPKIDPSVYLVAQISKLDELQLVPAKANIFFDGTYMGETYIDPRNMEDTLSLSLGKDPNIIVKRTLLKKESKEKIIGNEKERTNSFEIEIKNLKSTNIEVIVQDQIPVTTNADITIEAGNLDKAKLDPVTGILEWKLDLKTKESKKLNFSYKVKFNKDQNVSIQ